MSEPLPLTCLSKTSLSGSRVAYTYPCISPRIGTPGERTCAFYRLMSMLSSTCRLHVIGRLRHACHARGVCGAGVRTSLLPEVTESVSNATTRPIIYRQLVIGHKLSALVLRLVGGIYDTGRCLKPPPWLSPLLGLRALLGVLSIVYSRSLTLWILVRLNRQRLA